MAIGRLLLLEGLEIDLPALDPQISFAPLAALPRLQGLKISQSWGENGQLSDAQVDQLRALPGLQKFNMKI